MEPPAQPDPDRCRCGHPRAAHEHYRSGSDCSVCGPAVCDRFRPAGSRVRRAVSGLLRRVNRTADGDPGGR
jgi:hypothetical protein